MQRSQRGPKRIGDVLANVLARRGYGETQTNRAYEEAWGSAVGDTVAGYSRPAQLRRGVLEVVVRDSSTLQELTFQKKQLLRQLNESLTGVEITDLKFRVGSWE